MSRLSANAVEKRLRKAVANDSAMNNADKLIAVVTHKAKVEQAALVARIAELEAALRQANGRMNANRVHTVALLKALDRAAIFNDHGHEVLAAMESVRAALKVAP